MTNALSQLSNHTTIVADTGDFQAIDQYKPQDATTNPSLILKAVVDPKYQHFLEPAVTWAKAQGGPEQQQLDSACDMLAVMLGKEILNIVPGYVSTEVDARLSFDTNATIAKAKKLIGMYDAEGIDTKRVLIKIASTWEGIKAAEVLEKEGIKCNLTLLFSFSQAVACAQANIFLISPFVGRIADWYKKNSDETYAVDNGPGVQSVRNIYNYYKAFDYKTIVMGASFRNTDQIKALAGCDRLTIAPALLEQLSVDTSELKQTLNADNASSDVDNAALSESGFRWAMSQDAMATDKLAEGIRGFAADQEKLIGMLREIY